MNRLLAAVLCLALVSCGQSRQRRAQEAAYIQRERAKKEAFQAQIDRLQADITRGPSYTFRPAPPPQAQKPSYFSTLDSYGNSPSLATAAPRTGGGAGQFGAPSPSPFASTALPSLPSTPAYSSPRSTSYSPSSQSTSGYYSRYFDSSYRPAVGDHYVSGYFRKDGTYVSGHRRTNRDDSFWNNYSSYGNVNPYTGKVGSVTPYSSGFRSYSGSTYVNGYYRKDGTYVRGHTRRR